MSTKFAKNSKYRFYQLIHKMYIKFKKVIYNMNPPHL